MLSQMMDRLSRAVAARFGPADEPGDDGARD